MEIGKCFIPRQLLKSTNKAGQTQKSTIKLETDADTYLSLDSKNGTASNLKLYASGGNITEDAVNITMTGTTSTTKVADSFLVQDSAASKTFIDADAANDTVDIKAATTTMQKDASNILQIDATALSMKHGAAIQAQTLDSTTTPATVTNHMKMDINELALESTTKVTNVVGGSNITTEAAKASMTSTEIVETASTKYSVQSNTGSKLLMDNAEIKIENTHAAHLDSKIKFHVEDTATSKTSTFDIGYGNGTNLTPTMTTSTTDITQSADSMVVTAPSVTHKSGTTFKVTDTASASLLETSGTAATGTMALKSGTIRMGTDAAVGTAPTKGMEITGGSVSVKHDTEIDFKKDDGANDISQMKLGTSSALMQVTNQAGALHSKLDLTASSAVMEAPAVTMDAATMDVTAHQSQGVRFFTSADSVNPIFKITPSGIESADQKEVTFWYDKQDAQVSLNCVLGGLTTDLSNITTSIGSTTYSPELLNSQSWLDSLSAQKKESLDLSRASSYEEGDSRLALQIYELAKKINFLEANNDPTAVDSLREVIDQFMGVAVSGGDSKDMLNNIGRTVSSLQSDVATLLERIDHITNGTEMQLETIAALFALRDYFFYARQSPTIREHSLDNLTYAREEYLYDVTAATIARPGAQSYSFPTFDSGAQSASAEEVRVPVLYREKPASGHFLSEATPDTVTPFTLGYMSIVDAGRDGATQGIFASQFDDTTNLAVAGKIFHIVLVRVEDSAVTYDAADVNGEFSMEAYYDTLYNTYMQITKTRSGGGIETYVQPADPLASGYDSSAPQAYSLKTYRPRYELIHDVSGTPTTTNGITAYIPPSDPTAFHANAYGEVAAIEFVSGGVLNTYTVNASITLSPATFNIAKTGFKFFYNPPDREIDLKFVASMNLLATNTYTVRIFKKDNLLANSVLATLSSPDGREAKITNVDLTTYDLEDDDFPGGYNRIGKINFLPEIAGGERVLVTDIVHAGFLESHSEQVMHARYFTDVTDITANVEAFHVRKSFLGMAVLEDGSFVSKAATRTSFLEIGQRVGFVGSQETLKLASIAADGTMTWTSPDEKPPRLPTANGDFNILVKPGKIEDGEFVPT